MPIRQFTKNLIIFYDGTCSLCQNLVLRYQKKDTHNLLTFIDSLSPDFFASKYGIDAEKLKTGVFGMDDSSKIYAGIDCFIQIWERLPGFYLSVFLFKHPKLRPAFQKFYKLFVKHIHSRLTGQICNAFEGCNNKKNLKNSPKLYI